MLQKDVARLRRFYRRRGFLQPEIDWIARLDTVRNEIDILFTIDEGPPLIVQSFDFFGPDGRAAIYQFDEGKERQRWEELRAEISALRIGERFTQFKLSRVQDLVLERLTNRGYAFARVQPRTEVDSAYNVVDVRLDVDAGPQAYIDSILVSGNRSVGDDVVLRELPFGVGDRFEYRKLIDGQRQLFGLDLFRVALIDVKPGQPQDTTVTIRVNIEEASPRLVGAQTGYAFDEGINFSGEWRHRNFFGDARRLSTQVNWITGVGPFLRSDVETDTEQNVSVSLTQPYIGTSRLSGTVSPFWRRLHRQIEVQEIGLLSSLIFEWHTFRPVTLQHTFARANLIGGAGRALGTEFYNKSILTLTARFGKADNYVRPRDGLLVQPFVEIAGRGLSSDVEYGKTGGEILFYRPLSETYDFAARLFVGHIWPFGNSKLPQDPVTAERFRAVLFYAGGGNDVRGWGNRLLGPKEAELDTLDGGGVFYRPEGGLSKVAGNLELRMPVPGWGSKWQAGIFLDYGFVGERRLNFDPSNYFYGTGAGLRYRTAAGFLRIDLAYKLNPTAKDLRRAEAYFRQGADAPTVLLRRFKLHLSIGQAF